MALSRLAEPSGGVAGAAETNGALLKGAGSVVAGGTTIVGGDNGWLAVASEETPTISIEADKITASAATAVLTAQDADATITVAGSTLAVTGSIKLDSSKGKVVLTGSATPEEVGKLLLNGDSTVPGELIVDSSKTESVVITDKTIAVWVSSSSADTDGTVVGTGIAIEGGGTDASSGVLLGSISGG